MVAGTRFISAVVATLLVGAPAVAQESKDWVVQVTPYVWATGIGGDITPFTGAPSVSFSSSFADVLEDLDAAFFISGYARRDRFVMMGDLSFSESSKNGTVPAIPGPLPPGTPLEGRLEQTSLTLAAGYRAVDDGDVAVDLLAGARIWSIKASAGIPAVGLSTSPSFNFTDPILALRANIQLAPGWSTILYGDIGGFGVGSEQTSQIVATVNYQVRDNFFVSAGYRALNFDYRDGGTRIDTTMSGPIFGASWRF